jgi:hypothetical protein
MGRKQLYKTESEQLQARRERQLRYYERNKERLNKQRLEKYYRSKVKKKNTDESLAGS